MKRLRFLSHASCRILSVVLGLLVCSVEPVCGELPTANWMSNDLQQVFLALRETMASAADFPDSLAKLKSSVDPRLFVCPGTGSRPGQFAVVDDWTDYVYVGGGSDMGVVDAALVISPPENHEGRCGYVLFSGGTVSRLPADQVRQLIADPFALATNGPAINLAYERQHVVVRVPKRLRPAYPPERVFPTDPEIQNLSRIWIVLNGAAKRIKGPRQVPASLVELGPSANSNLFVCASTGSRPGPMSEVQEWSDYVYVGNVWLTAPDAVLAISPPENYAGKHGYVLFANAAIRRLPPDEVRNLIKNPLRLVPSAATRSELAKEITVTVPKRLRAYYSEGDGDLQR